jgi:hypothetical protein
MSNERPGFSESLGLIVLLAKDLGELAKFKGKVEEPFFRRLTIRNFFPVFEAFLNHLKVRAVEAHKYGKVTLTEKALEELNDPAPRLRDALKVAFRSYAQARGTTMPLGNTLQIPSEFDTCVRVRNRLIHPRRLLDMKVSDEEVASLVAMLTWFKQLADWSSAAEIQYIRQIRNQIKGTGSGGQ